MSYDFKTFLAISSQYYLGKAALRTKIKISASKVIVYMTVYIQT